MPRETKLFSYYFGGGDEWCGTPFMETLNFTSKQFLVEEVISNSIENHPQHGFFMASLKGEIFVYARLGHLRLHHLISFVIFFLFICYDLHLNRPGGIATIRGH